MVKKRSRFMPGFQSRFMPAPRPLPSTRSSVRSTTFAPSFRRSYDDDFLYAPYRPSVLPHYSYDTSGSEYATASDINRELIMSSAAMEDNFDISNRSRQRDRDVLAAANRAISTPMETPTINEPLQSSTGTTGYTRRRSTTRRSKAPPRSHSVPPKRPTYTTTTCILPLDLKASDPPKPSAYLNYSKTIDNIRHLQCGTYDPMYSDTVRTSFSPSRDISPYRTDSPFRSDSSYRSVSPYRDISPYRDTSISPLETRSRLVKKRHKPPRVLASKRRVGNYYDRLLSKKSKSGKEGKYWPYIDVEDIDKESLGDILSDTEVDITGNSGCRYDYVITGGDDGSGMSYEPITYSYNYDSESDIPDDYVPFRPKARVVSPERDYSQMSVIPYLPTRDPTKNTSQDDISFNAVVAASAARARKALENINWNEFESAGLVLSVEGEYTPPSEEAPLGFRYISRPIMLKVPANQRVRAADSDNAFTKYMTDLQKFRESIRARLEDGYKAISRETSSCVSPSLPAIASSSYTSMYTRPIRTHYRSRLTDDTGYKYGHSLELYPLSSGSRTRSLTASDDLPHSGAIKLYDSKHDKYERLGTLARVEIKAALLANKVEVDLPRRRTPRSSYAQARLREMRKSKQMDDVDAQPVAVAEVTSGLRAHAPVYDPTFGKPYWGVEGVRKPNIMSWQYRLDAYASPDDLIIVPRSLNAVRSQLRDAHEKLDHHKQLMDRYLVADKGFSVEDSIALAASKAHLGERV
ncbi:uncharacterized protein LOC132757331 isoform X3 [Ruditapes philippinarum]|uniref:uncharacterized protein LOC132757331 isoform X3 n=2 Tax=Ruditapes philippinarum TaxID=129788 RepID=UPI00295AE545|nr:uncharacterized protein LOC132757331 isoform X3 [Ruditapes philippinarum]